MDRVLALYNVKSIGQMVIFYLSVLKVKDLPFSSGREDGEHSDRACLPKAAYDLSKQEVGSAGRNRQGKTPSVLQEHQSRLQDAQRGHQGHLHRQEMPLHW